MGGRRQHLTVVIYLNLPIRDVECLPMCFCKSYSENPIYLLKLASCKSAVLSSYLMIYPRTFLEGRSPLQPHRPCEYEKPMSTGFQVIVTKSHHKEGFFPAPLLAPVWFLQQPEPQGKALPRLLMECSVQKKYPSLCIPESSLEPFPGGHIPMPAASLC